MKHLEFLFVLFLTKNLKGPIKLMFLSDNFENYIEDNVDSRYDTRDTVF